MIGILIADASEALCSLWESTLQEVEKIEPWRKATVIRDEGRSEQRVSYLAYVNATTSNIDMLEQDTYRIHFEYHFKDPLPNECVSVTFCMRALAMRGRSAAAVDACCE